MVVSLLLFDVSEPCVSSLGGAHELGPAANRELIANAGPIGGGRADRNANAPLVPALAEHFTVVNDVMRHSPLATRRSR
jgi:hypothetical protein